MKAVIVSIKTEATGGVSATTDGKKQMYLTLEDAVEASATMLHVMAAQERLVGLIDIEEG
jgi:hypothetical protein